ncbi:hypothetical protein BT96DRAFT_326919 [Gymnopus androsaceus JB14]|uniref:Uncharacterized protein n=1 Tax=Gymnopus androsaceus JB14 TaxID=1447944 RepID=A0A6A4I4S6_9AGAR|nr:hypothetical protein BT96DRAFT_326919 [Gymnopus androsaceus JB14]
MQPGPAPPGPTIVVPGAQGSGFLPGHPLTHQQPVIVARSRSGSRSSRSSRSPSRRHTPPPQIIHTTGQPTQSVPTMIPMPIAPSGPQQPVIIGSSQRGRSPVIIGRSSGSRSRSHSSRRHHSPQGAPVVITGQPGYQPGYSHPGTHRTYRSGSRSRSPRSRSSRRSRSPRYAPHPSEYYEGSRHPSRHTSHRSPPMVIPVSGSRRSRSPPTRIGTSYRGDSPRRRHRSRRSDSYERDRSRSRSRSPTRRSRRSRRDRGRRSRSESDSRSPSSERESRRLRRRSPRRDYERPPPHIPSDYGTEYGPVPPGTGYVGSHAPSRMHTRAGSVEETHISLKEKKVGVKVHHTTVLVLVPNIPLELVRIDLPAWMKGMELGLLAILLVLVRIDLQAKNGMQEKIGQRVIPLELVHSDLPAWKEMQGKVGRRIIVLVLVRIDLQAKNGMQEKIGQRAIPLELVHSDLLAWKEMQGKDGRRTIALVLVHNPLHL